MVDFKVSTRRAEGKPLPSDEQKSGAQQFLEHVVSQFHLLQTSADASPERGEALAAFEALIAKQYTRADIAAFLRDHADHLPPLVNSEDVEKALGIAAQQRGRLSTFFSVGATDTHKKVRHHVAAVSGRGADADAALYHSAPTLASISQIRAYDTTPAPTPAEGAGAVGTVPTATPAQILASPAVRAMSVDLDASIPIFRSLITDAPAPFPREDTIRMDSQLTASGLRIPEADAIAIALQQFLTAPAGTEAILIPGTPKTREILVNRDATTGAIRILATQMELFDGNVRIHTVTGGIHHLCRQTATGTSKAVLVFSSLELIFDPAGRELNSIQFVSVSDRSAPSLRAGVADPDMPGYSFVATPTAAESAAYDAAMQREPTYTRMARPPGFYPSFIYVTRFEGVPAERLLSITAAMPAPERGRAVLGMMQHASSLIARGNVPTDLKKPNTCMRAVGGKLRYFLIDYDHTSRGSYTCWGGDFTRPWRDLCTDPHLTAAQRFAIEQGDPTDPHLTPRQRLRIERRLATEQRVREYAVALAKFRNPARGPSTLTARERELIMMEFQTEMAAHIIHLLYPGSGAHGLAWSDTGAWQNFVQMPVDLSNPTGVKRDVGIPDWPVPAGTPAYLELLALARSLRLREEPPAFSAGVFDSLVARVFTETGAPDLPLPQLATELYAKLRSS